MERVYTNHRNGERRIHIELDEAEVRQLADGNELAVQQVRDVCAEVAPRWPAGDDVRG